MCWRNGIWHLCVKIASPANTFAIISLVQHGAVQAAVRPPYGARQQHLHEGWAGEGKLQLLWLSFLQGLLHYHNVVREHDGCGVSSQLPWKGEFGVTTQAFWSGLSVPVILSFSPTFPQVLFFFFFSSWFLLPFASLPACASALVL